jgi:phosphate transport system substrate-binding protein
MLRPIVFWLTVLLALVPGCKRGEHAAGAVTLNGAGATFPYPLYSKWVSEYQRRAPNVLINYQSIGSGGGIRQVTERTVDFGASDAPLTDAQLAKTPTLVHIPTTLGAVVVTYNLPHAPPDVDLSPDLVAGIFLGEIKQWNDARLAALNPSVTLPATPIAVVHRSDGSGTTAVFTDYLSKVNATWRARVGKGTSVSWPVGIGAKGNEGVTGQVKTTPGAVGYVELAYALENGLPTARIRNSSGKFIKPSIEGITAAAASVARRMPDDLRMSIVDPPGASAYPIASFTYILVYRDMPDRSRAEPLTRFLWWALHDGQKYAAPLHYAPLPSAVVASVEAKLRGLTSRGRPLLPANYR